MVPRQYSTPVFGLATFEGSHAIRQKLFTIFRRTRHCCVAKIYLLLIDDCHHDKHLSTNNSAPFETLLEGRMLVSGLSTDTHDAREYFSCHKVQFK